MALLQALAAEEFADRSLEERTLRLRSAAEDRDERFAMKQLKGAVFGLLFGQLDATGRNPVWPAVGYPGPLASPPSPVEAPKTIPVERIAGDHAVMDADVCVVGSGAGGSVIAARLAAQGRSVIVLEQGGYRNEADFDQLDAKGAEMFMGGGLVWSEGGELGLLAGATLGGGTVINSMVSLKTPRTSRAVGRPGSRRTRRAGVRGVHGSRLRSHQRETRRRRTTTRTRNAWSEGSPPWGMRTSPCPGTCRWTTTRSTADTATTAACSAASSRRSRPICRTPPIPAPASWSTAASSRVTTKDGRVTGVDALVRGS
jgi:hypothetical protein